MHRCVISFVVTTLSSSLRPVSRHHPHRTSMHQERRAATSNRARNPGSAHAHDLSERSIPC